MDVEYAQTQELNASVPRTFYIRLLNRKKICHNKFSFLNERKKNGERGRDRNTSYFIHARVSPEI